MIPQTKYSALLMKRIPVVHFFGFFLAFHFVIHVHLLSPFEFHCCHDVICQKFLWLTGQTMLFHIVTTRLIPFFRLIRSTADSSDICRLLFYIKGRAKPTLHFILHIHIGTNWIRTKKQYKDRIGLYKHKDHSYQAWFEVFDKIYNVFKIN